MAEEIENKITNTCNLVTDFALNTKATELENKGDFANEGEQRLQLISGKITKRSEWTNSNI